MHRYNDLERFVFFKCNDCKKAFWKKALPAPRDRIIQHRCLLLKVSTRKLGFHSIKCKGNHQGSACIEKITKAEYMDSDPNCGKYAKYLEVVKSAGIKSQPARRKKRNAPRSDKKARPRVRKKVKMKRGVKKPAVMTEAVKNILVQNELLHTWKKQKRNKIIESKSVWDPGYSEDGSSDEFKTPPQPTVPQRHLPSDPDILQNSLLEDDDPKAGESESSPTTSTPVVQKPVNKPSLRRRSCPLAKRRKYSTLALGLPCTARKGPPIPPPSPSASETEWESSSASEPTVPTIDELIAHGLSESEVYDEEKDMLTGLDLPSYRNA